MQPPFSPGSGRAPSALELFLAFLEVGLSGFGGVLPFARRALVERRAWLTEASFNETLALCQSLPGPNIVNLSVVVGSRFDGVRGAVASVAGLVLAPVAIIIALATLWRRFGTGGHVPGAMRGLAAAAAGLTGATALKMARPMIAGSPRVAGPLMGAAFVGVALLRWPLVWVLLAVAPVGVLLAWRTER